MEKFKKDVFKKTKSSKHIFLLRNLKRLTALFLALITIVTTYTGDWKFLSFNGLNRVWAADDTGNKVNIILDKIPTSAAEESGNWTLTYKNSNGDDKTAVREAVTISSETAPSGQFELSFDIGEDELKTAESMSLSYEKTDTNGFILRLKDSITVDGNSIDGYTADVTNVFDSEKYDKYFSYKAEIADAEGYMGAEDLAKAVSAKITDSDKNETLIDCSVSDEKAVISGVVKYDANKTYTLSITDKDTDGNFASTEKQISVSSSGNVEESSTISLARVTQDYTVSLKDKDGQNVLPKEIVQKIINITLIQKDKDESIKGSFVQNTDANFEFSGVKRGISYTLSVDLGKGYVPFTCNIDSIGKDNTTGSVNIDYIQDAIEPQISVTYTSDKSNEENGVKYFNAENGTTATIRIEETNFSLNDTKVKVKKDNVETEISADTLGWTTDTSNPAVHTATYQITEEGAYELIVESTDKAKNNSSVTESVVVDKKAPEIKVEYTPTVSNTKSSETATDGETKYFNAKGGTTATITITDKNFTDTNIAGDKDFTKVTVTKNGKEIHNGTLTWTQSEENKYTATYEFKEEGAYTLTIESTDKATNSSSATESVVVDTEAPTFTINYNSLEDTKFTDTDNKLHIFYKDTAAITITVKDNISGISSEDDIKVTTSLPAPYKIEKTGRDNLYTISISKNANVNEDFEITVSADDIAGNNKEESYKGAIYIEDKATFDSAIGGSGITFEFEDKPSEDTYKGDGDNGDLTYYNKLPKVVMTANQTFSGISSFSYKILKHDGKGYNEQYKLVEEDNIRENGGIATSIERKEEITSDGKYKALFSFKSNTDYSSEVYSKEFVVDREAPVIDVAYYNTETDTEITEITTDGVTKYFNAGTTAKITITETNFISDKDWTTVTVTKDGENIDIGTLTWSQSEENKYTASYEFKEEGVYTLTVETTDKAANNSSKTENLVIDRTAPTFTINYNSLEDTKFTDTDNKLHIFYKDTAAITITVKDNISGISSEDDIKVTTSLPAPYKIEKTGSDKLYTISISKNANVNEGFEITVSAKDMAENNKEGTYEGAIYIEDKATFDSSIDGSGITFEFEKEPSENSYDGDGDLTYYNKLPKVVMTANQTFSGISSFSYKILKHDGNGYNEQYKLVGEDNIRGEDGGIATSIKREEKITSDGKYEALFSFKSNTDYSSEVYKKEFVVDTEAPEISVTYNQKNYKTESSDIATDKVTKYFNAEKLDVITATITVKDINFIADKDWTTVTVTKDGKEIYNRTLTWTQSEENPDEYTATYEFKEDGAYTLTVESTDKATNNLSVTECVVVDKTVPVINVTYDQTASNTESSETATDKVTKYFNAEGGTTATITITDTNFTSGNTTVTVNGNTVDKNDVNWTDWEKDTSKTNVYTAKYKFSEEGAYELKVESTDKAANKSTATENVVVDKTAPEIKVEYTPAASNTESSETATDGVTKYFNAEGGTKATITITDKNFTDTNIAVDNDFTKVTVTKDGKEIHNGTLTWTQSENNPDEYTATYEFKEDGAYTLEVESKDKATNGSSVTESLVVDTKAPEIKVEYTPTASNTESSETATDGKTKYFNAKGGTTATITITDKNFTDTNIAGDKDFTKVTVTKDGKEIHNGTLTWTQSENNPDEYTATYEFTEDGAYTLTIESTDKAVNNSVNTESLVVDTVVPEIKVKYSTTPSNTEDGKTYYKEKITATITITDKNFTDTDIAGDEDFTRVTVTRDGEKIDIGTLTWTTDPINSDVHTATYTFSDDADYILTVETTDKATNTAASYDSGTFVIDNTNPQIKVEYNYNDAQNGNYYKADRTAIITVTEHNFKVGNVEITATKDGVSMPVAASFRDNGDEHVMVYTFSDDGDYTLTLHCTDLAARKDTYNTVDSFTVDKTLPSITIDISGVSPTGDNYFDSARTATITVNEHNFNPSDFVLRLTATDNGAAIEAPAMSSFTSSGDVHTATVIFDRDEEISISADYMDLAGNAAETPAEQKFVIDLTEPVITLDTNSLVIDKTYGKAETVTPRITVTDTNFDQAGVNIQVEGKRNGVIKTGISSDTVANGLMYTISDINEDDVYTLSVTVRDRAGRESVYSADFRVNRNGSSYTLGNSLETLNKTYVKLIDGDLYFVETNVDRLESYVLTYSRGGMIAELAEGTDYTVSVSTNSYGWQEYTYKINQSVFSEEGEYIITVNSKDIAGNSSDNTSKNKGVSFVVDKTPPTQVVTGVEDNGIYTQASLPVTVEVYDNIAVNELKVTLNGETKTYTEKEINQNSGKINIDIASSEKQQVLEVSCVDYAGNTADTQTFRFTVSTNAFITFKAKYMSKPIFWILAGCAVVAAAGGITGFIFIRKRKKEAKEN